MFDVPRRVRLLAGAVLPLALLTGCGPSAATQGGAGDSGELVFASIPSEESTSLEQDFEPLIRMLEDRTGKQIRMEKATDYAAVIEGQRSGKIDIAMYGPLSYVVARNNGVSITPVGAQTEGKGKPPGYQSFGVVPKDSPIRSLADLKGKAVCFVDPNSTSGYLYPKAGLAEAGVNADRDVQAVMAGGHDASALGVASGQCDAGFATDTMINELLPAKGAIKPGDLRVVWKSEMIPGSPAAISDDLDPAVKQALTDGFRDANADYLRQHGYCEGECQISGYWGFTPVDDATFDSVRDVCAVTRDKQCTGG